MKTRNKKQTQKPFKKKQISKKFKKRKQKGFFSFVIVLALALILLTIVAEVQNNNSLLAKTKNELIKSEIGHKEKTLLESNTDTIIETKLKEQMKLRNFKSTSIENAINTALYNYLKEKAKTYDTITKKQETLSINYLNENTKVFIYEIDGTTYGEYSFTSNLTKSSTIRAELGDKTKQEFFIPAGYIIKKILGADFIELN